MKKLVIPAAGAGGIWLAYKAICLAEAGMTRLLMLVMGLDEFHAAARAPFAVWAALAVLCGVAAVSLTAWEEAERGRRMAAAETNKQKRPEAGERKAG